MLFRIKDNAQARKEIEDYRKEGRFHDNNVTIIIRDICGEFADVSVIYRHSVITILETDDNYDGDFSKVKKECEHEAAKLIRYFGKYYDVKLETESC